MFRLCNCCKLSNVGYLAAFGFVQIQNQIWLDAFEICFVYLFISIKSMHVESLARNNLIVSR